MCHNQVLTFSFVCLLFTAGNDTLGRGRGDVPTATSAVVAATGADIGIFFPHIK